MYLQTEATAHIDDTTKITHECAITIIKQQQLG